MGKLYATGICCICLSIWAIIQMLFMSFFYGIEASTLIEDSEPHEYTDFDDFILKSQENYKILSANCLYVALVYVLFLILSILAVVYTNKEVKKEALMTSDDDYMCQVKTPPKSKGPPKKTKDKTASKF